MLQCHTGARGWINCYLTLLDRVLEINAIFLLENHCLSFSFSFFPLRWGRSTEEGVLMELSQARQIRGGGGKDSTVGWTALSLSPGSAWRLAELTEPILSGCHCNINTHLEQMWLKAWNIEQTAATDPVPLHEHLCSINAVCSWGREGSLIPLSSLADGSSGSTAAMRYSLLLWHVRLHRSPCSTPTWPFTLHRSNLSFYIATSFLFQIYLYREMITFFF